MKTSSLLFLALAFTFLNACSQDEGDGKDEKGKVQIQEAAPVALLLEKPTGAQCASIDVLRNQCYREVLKNSPELISELSGRNPFLLKTWDQTDFSSSSRLSEITNCRVSYANLCGN